jgi:hypothetical protein
MQMQGLQSSQQRDVQNNTRPSNILDAAALQAHCSEDVLTRVENAVKQVRNSAFDEDASICIITVMKIFRNILLSPTSERKYRSVQLSNRTFHGKVGRVRGGIMILEAINFKRDNNNVIVLDDIDENKKEIWQAMKRLNVEADTLNIPASDRPVVPSESDIHNASSVNNNNNNNNNSLLKDDKDEFVVIHKKNVQVMSMDNVNDSIKQIRAATFDADAKVAVLTLMKMVRNVLVTPTFQVKKRSIRIQNPIFHEKIGRVRGGIDVLKAVGFESIDNNTRMVLHQKNEDKKLLYNAMQRLKKEAVNLRVPNDEIPKVPSKEQVDQVVNVVKKSMEEFDPYQTKIKRMTPQPRGVSMKSETEQKLEKLQARQRELLSKQVVPKDNDRNVNVYSPGNLPQRGSLARLVHGINRTEGSSTQVGVHKSSSRNSNRNLTESQLVLSTMKRRRDELKRQENFRTKAMRELERLEKMKIYNSVLLRIQFSDSWMVECNFSPAETVNDVINYLSRCLLAVHVNKEEIYLYITPPKQILQRDLTLADAGLQPAALVYIGSNGEGKCSGATCILPNIKEMSKKTNNDDYTNSNLKSIFPTSTPVLNEGKRNSNSLGGGSSSKSSNPMKKKALKKPKWLKT